ncbi:ankyrin repeat domain-containing protein [Leptospira weilii]|uniref:ankyrin repeat domain-containing protein n=1 Tax=Leptospira weilii TaxID=28184 RepID=UPI000772FE1A|nr:ankyrin repeat domain-containing protein [Leptospira weilii]
MSQTIEEQLNQAILSGNVSFITDYIQSGAGFGKITLVTPDGYGASPLRLAAIAETKYKGSPEITKLILENSSAEEQGEVLYFFASEDKYLEQASALLRAGIQVDSGQENSTPLQLAVGNQNPKMVYLLLSYGADPNRKGEDGSAFDSADSNPLYEGMLNSALNGNLKSPYYFIDLEKVKLSLNRWANSIQAFAQNNTDKTFYVFGIDGGRLVANSEEEFQKTLKKYQEKYPDRYNQENKIQSLRYNPGDFSFSIPEEWDDRRAGDVIHLDDSFLNPMENETRIEKELLRDGLILNRNLIFKDLKLSSDFRISAFGHVY